MDKLRQQAGCLSDGTMWPGNQKMDTSLYINNAKFLQDRLYLFVRCTPYLQNEILKNRGFTLCAFAAFVTVPEVHQVPVMQTINSLSRHSTHSQWFWITVTIWSHLINARHIRAFLTSMTEWKVSKPEIYHGPDFKQIRERNIMHVEKEKRKNMNAVRTNIQPSLRD